MLENFVTGYAIVISLLALGIVIWSVVCHYRTKKSRQKKMFGGHDCIIHNEEEYWK